MFSLNVLAIKNSGEGLGRLQGFFEREGFSCKIVSALSGKIPSTSDYDFIVILGGPMNVYEEQAYPFLVDEGILLRDALKHEIPVLGICLGAQLLAKALGARVEKNKVKEIGHYSLELSRAGRQNAFFRGVPSVFTAFQWHGDTFQIPQGASLLASSSTCLNQAFSFNDALGLQFHVEVDKQMAGDWVAGYSSEIEKEKIDSGKMLAEFEKLEGDYTRLSETIFSNFFK